MPAHLTATGSWRAALIESDVSSKAKYVGLVLSMHVPEVGTTMMPTNIVLAAQTSLHRKTIGEALDELEEFAWIKRGVTRSTEWVRLRIGRGPEVTELSTQVSLPVTRPSKALRSSSSSSSESKSAVSPRVTAASTSVSPTVTRKHDAIMDAMLAACAIDSAQVARSRWPVYQRCVNELRELGATPAEIERRAGNAWFKITPTSLVGRWGELSNGVGPRPKRDRAAEIRDRGKRG
jgi:hypothetical protein